MTGTNCDLFTHKSSRSYLNHLVYIHIWIYTMWFKYDRDKLWLDYTQIVPVIFEPPCIYTYMYIYKVVQIWQGQTVTCLHTNRPGHIWTTFYIYIYVYIYIYKVVQIWQGQTVTCLHTNRPGHIWTTLYTTSPILSPSMRHAVYKINELALRNVPYGTSCHRLDVAMVMLVQQ
jgi:hypothetical protein